MKKSLFILLLLLLSVSTSAADNIETIENEIKIVLNRVSPALVKVVSENSRKYVATGIALENELIITTSLITRHPFNKIYVENINGEKILAKIAGNDSYSGLTLLRLDEKKGPSPLPQARKAEVGSWVALIGLFYDRFPSIYQGIISSSSDDELILNAPVAPGSAGGAVVNKKGELLGIIRGSVGFAFAPDYTFKDHSAEIVVSGSKSKNDSLCYAIPIEKVNLLVEKLKTSGKIIYGWLGVNFSGDSNLIQAVVKDSPAHKAGIIKGDLIDEIAGKPVMHFRDITAAIHSRLAGEKIEIRIKRSGKALRLQVELGERSPQAPDPLPLEDVWIARPARPEIPPVADLMELPEFPLLAELSEFAMGMPKVKNYVIEFGGARQLGVDIIELTPELCQKFSCPEGYGLMISRVNDSPAAKKAGLQPGDIIVRAGGRECKTSADLRNVIKGLKEKEAVQIGLYRDGQMRKISIVPDKSETLTGDTKRFAAELQNLKDSINRKVKIINSDDFKQLSQAREKAEIELRKQKEQLLLKYREQRKKVDEEIQTIEAGKNKLSTEIRKKYLEQLKRIAEELEKIQANIRTELNARDSGDTPHSSFQE